MNKIRLILLVILFLKIQVNCEQSKGIALDIEGGVGISDSYQVSLNIGSNDQQLSLKVDLISPLIEFPCSEAEITDQKRKQLIYMIQKSNSKNIIKCPSQNQNVKCNFCDDQNRCGWKSYGDQIYSGYYIQDEIHLQNNSNQASNSINAYLVCTTNSDQLYGVLGLGRNIFLDYPPSFLNVGDIQEFSLCLAPQNGFMAFNRQLSYLNVNNGNRFEVDLSVIQGSYGIKVYQIKVGNQAIQQNFNELNMYGGGFQLNISQPQSYLNQILFRLFNEQYLKYCSQKNKCKGLEYEQTPYKYCYYYNDGSYIEEFFSSFPTIYFEFKQFQQFVFHPKNYLYEYKKNLFCMSILEQTNGNYNILGSTFFRQQEFVFDIKNEKLFIKESKCKPEKYGVGGEWNSPSSIEMIFKKNPFLIVLFILSAVVVCILIPICYQKFNQADQFQPEQLVDENVMKEAQHQYHQSVERLQYLANEEKKILDLAPIQEVTNRNDEMSSLQDPQNREIFKLQFNNKGKQIQQPGCTNIEEDLRNATLPNATNRVNQDYILSAKSPRQVTRLDSERSKNVFITDNPYLSPKGQKMISLHNNNAQDYQKYMSSSSGKKGNRQYLQRNSLQEKSNNQKQIKKKKQEENDLQLPSDEQIDGIGDEDVEQQLTQRQKEVNIKTFEVIPEEESQHMDNKQCNFHEMGESPCMSKKKHSDQVNGHYNNNQQDAGLYSSSLANSQIINMSQNLLGGQSKEFNMNEEDQQKSSGSNRQISDEKISENRESHDNDLKLSD